MAKGILVATNVAAEILRKTMEVMESAAVIKFDRTKDPPVSSPLVQ
jgi:hypothetical protein